MIIHLRDILNETSQYRTLITGSIWELLSIHTSKFNNVNHRLKKVSRKSLGISIQTLRLHPSNRLIVTCVFDLIKLKFIEVLFETIGKKSEFLFCYEFAIRVLL